MSYTDTIFRLGAAARPIFDDIARSLELPPAEAQRLCDDYEQAQGLACYAALWATFGLFGVAAYRRRSKLKYRRRNNS